MSVIDFCCMSLHKPDAMDIASLWADMIFHKIFWIECYGWNSYCLSFIISHCNYLDRMRAHISNSHLWIIGQTKAVDCMCDQTNITRFQYKLMIGNSIFPKFVKDCFG